MTGGARESAPRIRLTLGANSTYAGSTTIKAVVLKIAGKIADLVLPKLAYLWETATWKLAGRREGWLSVTPGGFGSKEALPPADLSTLSASGRNLLFIHGTFSHTKSAFRGLAATQGSDGRTLFENLREVYGDRIYGFDHFTICPGRDDADPAPPHR